MTGAEAGTAWDRETDVLIAGAGAAGLEAAIEAAAAGARVVVVEKQSGLDESSTALSVGRVSFSGTEVQARCGVTDSIDLMTRDILDAGRHLNDRALVDAFMAHQLDTWHQLIQIGVQWSPTVTAVAGMTVPRGHLTEPRALVHRLAERATALGASLLFDAPMQTLVTNDRGGVTGALVHSSRQGLIRLRARRGVILASGGFARDRDRLAAIDPRFANVAATSGVGHTGDALRMAEPLGALTRDIEHVQPSFEQHVSGRTSAEILLLYYQGGIIVNADGVRFVNESISYKDIARACLDQPGQMAFQVFDKAVHDKAVAVQADAGQSSPMSLDPYREALLLRGDTLQALACQAGIDPVRFVATVERYNRSVTEGRDPDFGRTALAGRFGLPRRLEAPPFFAYATIGHLLATYAGLAVDATMRVLRADGPIPGLFAAGEAIGGFHGASYHSGTGIGKALVFGRIAGLSAASNAR